MPLEKGIISVLLPMKVPPLPLVNVVLIVQSKTSSLKQNCTLQDQKGIVRCDNSFSVIIQ